MIRTFVGLARTGSLSCIPTSAKILSRYKIFVALSFWGERNVELKDVTWVAYLLSLKFLYKLQGKVATSPGTAILLLSSCFLLLPSHLHCQVEMAQRALQQIHFVSSPHSPSEWMERYYFTLGNRGAQGNVEYRVVVTPLDPIIAVLAVYSQYHAKNETVVFLVAYP